MAKREKFSIFGRDPDTKKGCYEFMQKKKKEWGVGYFLNNEEINHMKNLMSNYYYTPLEQAKHLVQGRWQEVKDKIKFIALQFGPIFYEPRFEFYNTNPYTAGFSKIDMITGEEVEQEKHQMWDFSVARCICFNGNGMVHESLPPKPAVSVKVPLRVPLKC